MGMHKFERTGCLIAAMAIAALSPALAADATSDEISVPEPPSADLPLASWSGLYGGIVLGYSHGRYTAPLPGEANGLAAGGFAGGQLQSGSIIYGLESEVGYNTTQGMEGSLRARLGYALNDDWMIYGTGGLAISRITAIGSVKDSKAAIGWTAGVGTELNLTDKVFSRLEYRYTDYDKKTLNVGGPVEIDTNNHRVMLGIGMRF